MDIVRTLRLVRRRDLVRQEQHAIAQHIAEAQLARSSPQLIQCSPLQIRVWQFLAEMVLVICPHSANHHARLGVLVHFDDSQMKFLGVFCLLRLPLIKIQVSGRCTCFQWQSTTHRQTRLPWPCGAWLWRVS